MPIPTAPLSPPSSGLKSKIRKVFRTTSGPDRNFSLVSQLTSAALCASSPALPKSSDVPPMVKSLLRPLSVPQLRYNSFLLSSAFIPNRLVWFSRFFFPILFQGDSGFAARISRPIEGQVRAKFHGEDREYGREAIAIEEQKQIKRRVTFSDSSTGSYPVRIHSSYQTILDTSTIDFFLLFFLKILQTLSFLVEI